MRLINHILYLRSVRMLHKLLQPKLTKRPGQLSRECVLCQLHNFDKAFRLSNCEFCKRLAVEFDTSERQSMD